MSLNNQINLKLYSLDELKKYFYEKKIKNVILFSQARSGSTFVSNILSKELGFDENFFSEQFFISKHFLYINRTFFGLYNLLHDLGAKINVNQFKKYIPNATA